MSVEEIRIIRAEIDKHKKRLTKAIFETYPLGQDVTFRLSRSVISCQVVMHGYGGRIKLRNVETDKTRWVHGDYMDLAPFVSSEKGGGK